MTAVLVKTVVVDTYAPPHCPGNPEAIVLHLDAGLGESEMGQKAFRVSHAAALWCAVRGTEDGAGRRK